MIDLKDLRANPEKYRTGLANKGYPASLLEDLLAADAELRPVITRREQLTAEKNQISKQIGQLVGRLKNASDAERAELQQQMQDLKARPDEIKDEESALAAKAAELEAKRDALWLRIPQPADPDVPVGKTADDNVQISEWHPDWFDPARPFKDNKGFTPKTHIELGTALGLFDFERGVKMAGSRSYVLTGDGMRLHQAILRCAFDFMINENGFTPLSVPVIVRDECMIGTAFFPDGKEQAYEVKETDRGGGYDLYLTGTGEVGLMGYHQNELLDAGQLPLCYTTVSTCFRREAGAAGKDTAGLYRVHQFDKVEQVVICEADEQTSRDWHKKMMGFVETLLRRLELPYRLLQCCTGDLGPKNADMVDIESWMPGRGNVSLELLDDVRHYKLQSSQKDWFSHARVSRVRDYLTATDGDFYIVLWNSDWLYKIPYSFIKSALTNDAIHRDKKDGDRWIFHMPQEDTLTISSGAAKERISIGQFKESNRPTGAYGETHSASRLYDYQCRRLNLRYRDGQTKKPVFCHSLNNTVAASPRLMVPILEMYQNADGSVTIPAALRPYLNDQEQIQKR